MDLEQIDQVVAVVYDYIRLLQTEGPQEWVFEEIRQLSQIQFRFKEKQAPMTYVSSLCSNMQEYEPEWVIAGPYIVDQFEPKQISDLLECFVPQRMKYAIHLLSSLSINHSIVVY